MWITNKKKNNICIGDPPTHRLGKFKIKPRTATRACWGNELPAYLLMTSTTFRNVSTMSFLIDDNMDGDGPGTASEFVEEEVVVEDVASDTRKLRSSVICCSMCWTAYCSQLRQYFKHFMDSSLTTAAVVPAAELACTTNCCQVPPPPPEGGWGGRIPAARCCCGFVWYGADRTGDVDRDDADDRIRSRPWSAYFCCCCSVLVVSNIRLAGWLLLLLWLEKQKIVGWKKRKMRAEVSDKTNISMWYLSNNRASDVKKLNSWFCWDHIPLPRQIYSNAYSMKMPRFEEQILAYKIYHIIYASRAKLMVSSSFKSIAYKNFKGSNDKNVSSCLPCR